MKKYSKDEVIRAEQALEIMHRLAHPGMKRSVEIINNGMINNLPITSKDLIHAYDIYGTPVAQLKGKSTGHKTVLPAVEEIIELVKQSQKGYIDLMFVEQHPYLVNVLAPLNYTICNRLASKNGKEILKILDKQLSLIRSRGFHIQDVITDSESGVQNIADEIRRSGISITILGQGESAVNCESKIRRIKERIRAVIHTLPYRIPSQWLQYLVYYVVNRVNMTVTSGGNSANNPWSLFYGRRINYKTDLKAGFGDYVQWTAAKVDNTMNPRSHGGITMYDTADSYGNWWIYNFETQKILRRNSFVIKPITEQIIGYINNLSTTSEVRDIEVNNLSESIRDTDADDDKQYEDNVFREYIKEMGENFFKPTKTTNVDIPFEQLSEHGVEQNDDHQQIQSSQSDTTIELQGLEDEDVTNLQTDVTLDIEDTNNQENNDTSEIFNQNINIEQQTNDEDHHYRTKSGRIVKKNQKYDDDTKRTYGLHFSVMKSLEKFGSKAEDAIKKELMQMISQKVFHAVEYNDIPLKERSKIIRSHMFVKEKFLPNGEFEKIKARLVADGRGQDEVHDAEKTSPTVSVSSIFLLAAMAGTKSMCIATMDVPGAYLKAPMPKNDKSKIVRMKLNGYLAKAYCELLPEEKEFMLSDGSVIVELDKALYGCLESARLWHESLKGLLYSIGYKCNAYDKCVFQKKNDNYLSVILTIYVDDIMLMASSQEVLDLELCNIKKVLPDIVIHRGSIHNYIGMVFDFSTTNKVVIAMDQYVRDLLVDFSFDVNSKVVSAPGDSDLFSIDANSVLLDSERKKFFHSSVAKLLYLAKRTRPDILLVISFLATRVKCSTDQDFHKLLRCVRYLRATLTFKLSLSAEQPFCLYAYIDAAYAVHKDFKSHTGVCLSMGTGILFARSVKQRLNVKSSTEAELVGIGDGLNNVIWAYNFLCALGFNVAPVVVWHDNQSVITMLTTGFTGNQRSRHINIRYYFAKDYIDKGVIAIRYKSTNDMIADVLTKPLMGGHFKLLRDIMLGIK